MSLNVLSWGKPTIQIGLVEGGEVAEWITLPTPIENTSKLTPTKGAKLEAKIEGGANEAVKYKRNTYTFECEIRQSASRAKPIQDLDGVVEGEYSIKILPENRKGVGRVIHRANVSVEDSWDTENGAKWKYTFDVLEPEDGSEQVSELWSLSVTPEALWFASGADSTGKTITANSTGNITSSQSSAAWCTVTRTAKVATVKVTANDTGANRTANVTLIADGKSFVAKVTQIG